MQGTAFTHPTPCTSPLARDGIALHHPATRHHTPLMHTRCLTRHAHALHIAKGYAHAPRTRHASSSLTAHTPSVLPPLAKGYATRATHTLCILALTAHSPSTLSPLARAMPCRATTKHESHAPPRTHAPASFLRRKREPHNNQNITYYNITCNVYPNRSKDYTKKRGNLFLYRLNLLSLHDES